MPDAATDTRIVEALRSDRSAGFDLLYRHYAERLFAYAVTVVRDRSAAEDATHESLMSAVANIGRLRDPSRLRPWLFAITRNRCLSVVRERSRFAHDDETLAMIPVDSNPTAELERGESSALVQAALTGLAPADRDSLALALRHDLDVSEVAAAMGANEPTARARISRAKAALTASVTGLLLARDRGSCTGLATALAGFEGEWTPLIRKRVAKHAKTCPDCSERGTKRATAYVSAFSLPAVIALSSLSRARADEMLAHLDPGVMADVGSWTSDGFPRPVREATASSSRGPLIAAGAAAVVLIVVGGAWWRGSAQPQPELSMVALTGPAASATQSPTDPSRTDPAPTRDAASPSPTPTEASSATASPSATTTSTGSTSTGSTSTASTSTGRSSAPTNEDPAKRPSDTKTKSPSNGNGNGNAPDAEPETPPGTDEPTKHPDPPQPDPPTKQPDPEPEPEQTKQPEPDPTPRPTKRPEVSDAPPATANQPDDGPVIK